MAYFGPLGRKLALSVHVLSISIWLGAAIAMMAIAFLRPTLPDSSAALSAYCLAIKLIDDKVIVASAGLSLLSGLLLSWKTKWGFFVWYWIAFKLVATVAMVAFGATCLGPWIDETARIAGSHGLSSLSRADFQSYVQSTQFWGSAQITLLIVIVGISVFKPWGKIVWNGKRTVRES